MSRRLRITLAGLASATVLLALAAAASAVGGGPSPSGPVGEALDAETAASAAPVTRASTQDITMAPTAAEIDQCVASATVDTGDAQSRAAVLADPEIQASLRARCADPVETTLDTSAPEVLTARAAAQSGVDGEPAVPAVVRAAVASGVKVYSLKWSQSYHKAALWQETHSGVAFYTSSLAWSGVSHYGYKGSHSYATNYAIGWSMSDRKLSEDRRQELKGDPISEIHTWDANYIAKGVPIHFSKRMHVNIYGGGHIYGYLS